MPEKSGSSKYRNRRSASHFQTITECPRSIESGEPVIRRAQSGTRKSTSLATSLAVRPYRPSAVFRLPDTPHELAPPHPPTALCSPGSRSRCGRGRPHLPGSCSERVPELSSASSRLGRFHACVGSRPRAARSPRAVDGGSAAARFRCETAKCGVRKVRRRLVRSHSAGSRSSIGAQTPLLSHRR